MDAAGLASPAGPRDRSELVRRRRCADGAAVEDFSVNAACRINHPWQPLGSADGDKARGTFSPNEVGARELIDAEVATSQRVGPDDPDLVAGPGVDLAGCAGQLLEQAVN